MSSLWRNTSGDLIRVDGDLIRCDECPCGPPCSCPCVGTWPPASWPCGGLLEEYSFELPAWGFANYEGSSCSGDFIEGIGNRVLAVTVTAGDTSCTWEGTGMWQTHIDDPKGGTLNWGDYEEVVITVSLVDDPECRWEVEVASADNPSNILWFGYKLTGLTPAGQYVDDADPDGLYPTCTILNPGDPPEEQLSLYNYGTGATVS